VREAEADRTAAREELVERIRTARDEGIPFSLIARRVGLSRERVRQLYLGASVWVVALGADKVSRRVLGAATLLLRGVRVGVCPFGEPPHPRLLIGRLDGIRAICSAHPGNSIRRWNPCEDGHARQYRSGAAAAAQAADLDKPDLSRSAEGLRNLLRGKLWILG
jgi:hypothetical protein